MRSFDVVVIGAGPAGASAAREAAARGAGSVLLLEKESWPREKLCAGGLSPIARRQLRKAGLWERVRGQGYPIHAARLRTPGGRDLLLNGGRGALVVRRRPFDALLVEEAVRAGVELRTSSRAERLIAGRGGPVVLLADGTRIGAGTVIVANGAGAPLHRLPRPESSWLACLCRYEGVPFQPHTLELYFDAGLFPRYGWLFPESPDTVNIGFCMERGAPGDGRSPRERLEDFLRRSLGERLREARALGRARWRPVFPSPRVTPWSLPNVLLAGDALRLVNPFTGEGIGYALASGSLAARAHAAGTARGWDQARVQRCYVRSLRRRLEPSLRAGDWVCRRGRPLLRLAARAASTPLGRRLIYNALA